MNLKALILQGESEIIEFKRSTGESKEIIETIAAFSNTKGGRIIIGVSKSGNLLGVEVGKDTTERLSNQISQNTDPKIHPRITVEKIEEGKLQRQEKWLYPPRAIREALANALAHRDYKTTSSIQIRIFDDRLEVWNPGCLPSGLTIEKLKTKHDSIPRNPLIARAFFWVKYVEEVGTGTNKIVKWCKEWKLPEPEFEETGTSFVLTFRRFYVSESLLEILNERQKKAVRYLMEKGKITNREYQRLCAGLNRETIRKDLNDLINRKIIIRKGEKKGAYYELI